MGAYRSAAAGALRAREWTTRASAPSLDDPRFEAALLRLHLQRLHPHLQTTLQRLSAVERRACSAGVTPLPDEASKHDAILALPGELTVAERELVQFVRSGFSNKEIAARGVRCRLLAMMMPRLSYD